MRTMKLVALAALAAATVATAACGGGDSSGDSVRPAPTATPTIEPLPVAPSPSPVPARPSPDAVVAAPTPASAAFEDSTAAVEGPAPGSTAIALRAVRVASDLGFDTIVFEFDGEVLPGYRVQYADRPPSCPAPPPLPSAGGSSGSSGGQAPPPTSGPRIRGTPTAGQAPPTPTPVPATPTPIPTPTPTPVAIAGGAILAVRLSPASAESVGRTDFRGGEKAIVQATQVCDSQGVVAWAVGATSQRPFRVTVLEGPSRLVIDIKQ